MAVARLPVTIVLVLNLLQDLVQAQQLVLEMQNNPNIALSKNPTTTSDPRIAELISNAKNIQNCGKETSFTIQPQAKQQLTGLQQFLSLQQPINSPVNFQHPLPLQAAVENPNQQAVTFKHPLNAQQCQCANNNLQQTLNVQQPINQQQHVNHQQCLNLQQQITTEKLQQTQGFQEPINLQQMVLQQQPNPNIPINHFQIVGQPAPVQNELSLASYMPVINGNVQGLPSQVSQGVLLSNLGLTSNIPSLLTCCNSALDQSSNVNSQNNVAAHSLQLPQTPMFDGSQTTNFLPSLPSPTAEYTPYNRNALTSFTIPVTNSVTDQQSQTLDCPTKVQYQPCPNLKPVQNLQAQTVPVQSIPTQSLLAESVSTPIAEVQSINTQPLQIQIATQNQLTPNQVQNQPKLSSFFMSQMPSSNSNPSQHSNPGPYPAHAGYGSKSSSMKALLPLLFNLLKEKNGGCGCPQNCYCGCMNNNKAQDCQGWNPCMNNNCHNNVVQEPKIRSVLSSSNIVSKIDSSENIESAVKNNYEFQKPEVIDGYSNKIQYGKVKSKENITNSIESEELEVSKKDQEKQKYQNYKKMEDESIEEYKTDDDYGDSYETED